MTIIRFVCYPLLALGLLVGCPDTDLDNLEGGTTHECGDGIDNDGDGGSDCADAGCAWWWVCNGSDPDQTDDDDSSQEEIVDADGDGSPAEEDCDDTNSLIHPEAAELCDGADNDCDGDVDEGLLEPQYLDEDGDGYGRDSHVAYNCIDMPGWSYTPGDCDDTREYVYPGATEACNGIDDDCDTAVDDDCEVPSDCGPFPLDGYYGEPEEGVSSGEVPDYLSFRLNSGTPSGELSGDVYLPVSVFDALAICGENIVLRQVEFVLTTSDGSWHPWMSDIQNVTTMVTAAGTSLPGAVTLSFGPGHDRVVTTTASTVSWTVTFDYPMPIPEGSLLTLALHIPFGDGDLAGGSVLPGAAEPFIVGLGEESIWWGVYDRFSYPNPVVGDLIMGPELTYVP